MSCVLIVKASLKYLNPFMDSTSQNVRLKIIGLADVATQSARFFKRL